jgi:hypothetical protein
MPIPSRLLTIATLTLAVALLPSGGWASDEHAGDEDGHATLRVLLVGNSYSRFNDLPRMLEDMAASVPDGPALSADIAFRAGADLQTHWKRGLARRMLHRQPYTHVVLQDHSRAVFDSPEALGTYAQRFKEEADEVGARTLLFATWARHPQSDLYRLGKDARTPLEMQSRIDALYAETAARLGTEVVPVGDAWILTIARWPRLRLHRPDGSHPTRLGTYLTACVLYGKLTGVSPQRITHRVPGVAAETLDRLRAVAEEAIHRPARPAAVAGAEAP